MLDMRQPIAGAHQHRPLAGHRDGERHAIRRAAEGDLLAQRGVGGGRGWRDLGRRVAKLVLAGAYARGRNRRGVPMERETAQAMMTLMREGWGDERSAFMRAFSSVYVPSGSPEQLRWWVDSQRKATSAGMAVRLRAACDDIDVSALLPQVRAPTLVLHGRGDCVAPFAEGRLIAAGIPGARFVELESDNHVILEGEPAWPRYMQEIERFLAE